MSREGAHPPLPSVLTDHLFEATSQTSQYILPKIKHGGRGEYLIITTTILRFTHSFVFRNVAAVERVVFVLACHWR